MKSEYNFFDELIPVSDSEEAKKAMERQQADGARIDYLVHKVFAQSEEGKELLKVWRDALELTCVADHGMDMVGIGINEGQKRFIRGIILTIRRVEDDR